MGYAEVYQGWKADPEGFWMQAAKAIDWVRPPSRALWAERAPIYEWFRDAEVNTCWNALDRHVAGGRADQVAIIHDSPITGKVAKITYAELLARVARLGSTMPPPRRSSRRPAGSSRGGSCATSRSSMPRSGLRRTSPISA
jgi:propionyl-CoA synthetase